MIAEMGLFPSQKSLHEGKQNYSHVFLVLALGGLIPYGFNSWLHAGWSDQPWIVCGSLTEPVRLSSVFCLWRVLPGIKTSSVAG